MARQNDRGWRREPKIVRRPKLGRRQRELLLATVIRSRGAYDSLSTKLLPEHFDEPHDKTLSTILRALRLFFLEYERLPSKEHLFAAVEQIIEESPGEFSNEETESMTDVIELAYDLETPDLDVPAAMRLASQLMEETLHRDLQRDMDGDLVADLPAMLAEKAQRAAEIKSLQAGELPTPFPGEGLDSLRKMPGIVKHTTGCSFLDLYMGGQSKGEVYGLCAPYGVGKTMLAVQLGAFRAKWEQNRWSREQKRRKKKLKLPRVYLVFWEETTDSVRVRILSHLAQVPRTVIEECLFDDLSTGENLRTLKDYEQRMFAKELSVGAKVFGEKERLERAIQIVNLNIRFVDLTGANPDHRGFMGEMAVGAADVIRADQQRSRNPGVSMVIMDHANAAADTACDMKGLDPTSHKRHLIGGMPRQAKQNIAAPWGCPVWIMHQLAAKANSRVPGLLPTATDHAEAKDFFQYVDFGFMLGTKDKKTELCGLVSHKHRRQAHEVSTIIRMDGLFCTARDTNNRYIIDGSRIVTREEYASYAGDDDSDDNDSAIGGRDMERLMGYRSDDGIGV